MSTVTPRRFTAGIEGPFVVFLIGMRVNRVRAPRKWAPTFLAMGPMLRELYAHPELGFLGGHTSFSWRTVHMVQYWRSFEDLERFAKDRDAPHLPAWRRFNRVVGTDGSVGIFHETYMVEPGRYEVIYNNMPVLGLAAATERVPVRGRKETAAGRLEDPRLVE